MIYLLNIQLFGGRGAKSGFGRAKGKITLSNGEELEFDGELVYGGKDKALTGKARENIEAWEEKRLTAKIEYAYAVDGNGEPIGKEAKGTKTGVRAPYTYQDTENSTFTHIHPREESGQLGGTFSEADLRNFSIFNGKTKRATAKEGTYSITKGANFDAQGFRSFIHSANEKQSSDNKSIAERLINQYRKGEIGWQKMQSDYNKGFNTTLIELHNAYLSNQKTYGYTYTLEKRN